MHTAQWDLGKRSGSSGLGHTKVQRGPDSFPERSLRPGWLTLKQRILERSILPLSSEKPGAGRSSVSCLFSVSCSWRKNGEMENAGQRPQTISLGLSESVGRAGKEIPSAFVHSKSRRWTVNLVSLFIIKSLIEQLLCTSAHSISCFLTCRGNISKGDVSNSLAAYVGSLSCFPSYLKYNSWESYQAF